MNIRKRLAALLSAVMVLTAAMPVYAAENVETAVNSEVFETADTAEVTGSAEGTGSVEETGSIEEIGSLEEIEAVEAVEEIISAEETAEKEALKDGALLGEGGAGCFYIEAADDLVGISIRYRGYDESPSSNLKLEFSMDDGIHWDPYTLAAETYNETPPTVIPLAKKGDRVYFRAPSGVHNDEIAELEKFEASFVVKAEADKDYSVGGDITTLIRTEGNADIPARFFERMFWGCEHLISAKNLVIPDVQLGKNSCAYMFYDCRSLEEAPVLLPTVLGEACYMSMFGGCSSLTTAPELPAKTLAKDCYWHMFFNCTSLTVAPELPVETLANGCYMSMFGGCSNLTTAPELPAMTLADQCYRQMFANCGALETAPELPAETLAEYCYAQMFENCGALETAPELPVETLANGCYMSMFGGCSNLTTAPELPAQTLVDGCYSYMFKGCSNLKEVKVGFSSWNIKYTQEWLMDVSAEGTFYGPGTLPDQRGATNCHYIPEGWKFPHKITVTDDGNGTASADPASASNGETVTLTAVPAAGYRLLKWESDDVTVADDGTFTMPSKDVAVKAVFGKTEYAVNVSSGGNGTANADPSTAVLETEVTLTAVPDEGYRFDHWESSDVIPVNNKFAMPAKNVSVKAVFKEESYTVNAITAGGGTVSADHESAAMGTTVTLTASPDEGYTFAGWKSAEVTVADDGTFTMPSKNVTVIAVFEKISYTVTVTTNGGGSVNVTTGDTVILEPVPFAGYRFDRWESDDVTVVDNAFKMPYKNVTVNAVFEKIKYTVTVETEGKGTASADPVSAVMGTKVTLSATPAPGYRFDRWESSDVTVADDKFEMPIGNVTVKAVFEKIDYSVIVVTDGGGTVSVNPGAVVELTAMPYEGYRFDYWESDDVTIVDNKFEMPLKNVTVKANFKKYLYTVKFDSMGGSEVAAQTVASGEKAVKPTSPNRSGYSFAGWYADTACTKAFDFNTGISADTTVYAKWSKNSSSGGGSSSGGAAGFVKSVLFTGTWGNPVNDGHWSQDDTGAWHYTTTQLFCNTWAYIRNPYAHSGQHEADWFRFDANGIMLTGWQLIDGKWYYLNPTKDGTLGACLIGPGVTPDGYEIDATGAWTGR